MNTGTKGSKQSRAAFVVSLTKKVAEPLIRKPKMQNKMRQATCKSSKSKQPSLDTPRRSGRLASKPAKNKTMEQLAIELLLKKSGMTPQQGESEEAAQGRFAEQFCDPLTKEQIESFQELFGIGGEVGHALDVVAGQVRMEDEVDAN